MSVERIEGLLLAGDCHEARREAERQLEQGDLVPLVEAHLCHLACRACTAAADLFAAVRYGRRAVEIALTAGCQRTLTYAQFSLGCACARLGDGPPAREHLMACLAGCAMFPGAEALAGEAYGHLGLVHRLRRDWRQAAVAFGHAADMLRQHGRAREGARAALDLAGSLLQLGEPAQARPHLEAVAAYLSDRVDRELALDLLCTEALCHRLEGDLSSSSSLCQAVLGRPGASDLQLAEAAWIMGENALDLGRPHDVAAFATLALEHAVRAGSAALMNRVGDLRRRVSQPSFTED